MKQDQVIVLTDGTFLVWGTDVLSEAVEIFMADNEREEHIWMDEEFDYDVEPKFEATMRGLLRCNITNDPDCGWYIGYARKKGHGARLGVVLDFMGWEEVVFDDDVDLVG